MAEWYVCVLGEFCSLVCVVCLFNGAGVVACVCLCVYSWVYSCMHSYVCEGATVRCFSVVSQLMFPSKSQVSWHKVTGTHMWFYRAHLQAVHAAQDHRVHLHAEVGPRSTETLVFSPQRASILSALMFFNPSVSSLVTFNFLQGNGS